MTGTFDNFATLIDNTTFVTTGVYITSSNITGVSGFEQLFLVVKYTAAEASTHITVKCEFNVNGLGWGELAKGTDAAPASNVIETTVYSNRFKINGSNGTAVNVLIPISGGFAKTDFRVSVAETFVTNPGTITVGLTTYTLA